MAPGFSDNSPTAAIPRSNSPPHIMWAPTQMPEPSSYHSTKAMDEDDIRAVIDGFAASARNMVDAGLDGVEIKVAHDGLLRSFASPFFNRRTDGYGGSFENRMRLSLEVIAAIKAATGSTVPLGVRLCVNEFTPFGYDEEYGLEMAAALEATGEVDYFNSDAGSFSSYWMEIPPAAVAAADFQRINARLKNATRLPVIAFGRILAGSPARPCWRRARPISSAWRDSSSPIPRRPTSSWRVAAIWSACASPATTAASTRSTRRRRSAASRIPAPAASAR